MSDLAAGSVSVSTWVAAAVRPTGQRGVPLLVRGPLSIAARNPPYKERNIYCIVLVGTYVKERDNDRMKGSETGVVFWSKVYLFI